MNTIYDILREGAIIIGLIAAVVGFGYGALRLRRAMGGGIDDRIKMSRSELVAKFTKGFLTVTAILWILIWVFVGDEYGGNLNAAMDGFRDYFFSIGSGNPDLSKE